MNLTAVDLERIKSFLRKKFEVNEVSNLKILPNATVNNHVIFEIENKKFVMKILTRKPAAEHEYYRLEKEAQLMQQFKHNVELSGSTKKGVPVPNIIHIESEEDKIGFKFIIMEFIAGNYLEKVWESLEKTKKEKLVIELADIIREIHSVKYEMFGDIEDYDCPRKFYTYKRLLKSNVRKYARIIGPKKQLPIELISKAIKFVEDNIDTLELDVEPTLVHNDLHFGNFIFEKENCSIKAVLDFEWAEAGHPITDLFNIKDEFPFDEEQQKIFFKRYFQDEREDLDEYALLEKITTIIGVLSSVAVGWINFHPTVENLKYSKKKIEEVLED